ncbi:polyamine ABC transporter substrate-binding protein [Candidatus Sororendozoicomonas aggregata]|uniref:polyamine ABC transporter substrate-binding protein n=1 Tax=Candidatus Sororendozoicomonas aggregata TaxID=3073239 RepID=UPI002ED2177E
MKYKPLLAAAMIFCASALPAKESPQLEKNLYFYNWSDYIGPGVIEAFEKKTGVKVAYDVYDSNEVLQGKLLAGKSGFDLVSPSHDFYATQINAKVYQKLDKSLIPNLKNLDPALMEKISATIDPGNQYGIPYLITTTGIGYNKQAVEKALGKDAPINSWALVFEPENMKKLQKCGVAFLDAPTEILPSMMTYMGLPGDSLNVKDYQKAVAKLKEVAPYVTYFHSTKSMADLANGDICVAIAWSGDVYMARERAKAAKNGLDIRYSIPKEGAAISFDMLAIPADAPDPKAAHAMLNYLLEPKVAAETTNFVSYANPVPASTSFIKPEIANNPGIYPDPATKELLFIFKPLPTSHKRGELDLRRYITQQWRKITLTGH